MKKNFKRSSRASSSRAPNDYSVLSSIGLTDFHSHLLPGIDDGSDSVETSLRMLGKMREQNVSTVVATPHYYGDREFPDDFLDRRKQSERLLAQAMRGGNYPDVYIGAEVAYFSGMSMSQDMRKLCIKGTDYILVEMPFSRWDKQVFDDLIGLRRDMGLHPILAHVERYISFLRQGDIERLIDNNVLIQSNAVFFTEKKTQKKALRMMDAFQIRLLGSDSHNTEARRPDLGDGALIIKEKLGDEKLRMMSYIGKCIISGAEKLNDAAVPV